MSNVDYSEYNEKRVTLIVNSEDGTAQELEGTIVAGNALGVMFKPKGSSKTDIIEGSNIVEVRLAPAKPKKLTVKKLKPIAVGQVRQHLVDRHGYTIADIEKMGEAEAAKFHDELDHSGLGHRHTDSAAKSTSGADEVSDEGDSDED
jgi:hypothetical protein